MSIRIRVEKGALVMQAQLGDEALNELNALILKYHVGEAVPSSTDPSATTPSNQSGERGATVRGWLAKHAPAEVMNLLKWDTYPDKILILGACHEAKGGSEGWKSSDMEKSFAEAKESPPANFPRDIRNAIKSGHVRTVTPRTYAVSRTGWNRLADGLEKAGAI